MLDLFLNSMVLFYRGKLFKDPRYVLRQAVIGALIAATLLIAQVTGGITLGLAVAITAFTSGAMQPWLFRNLEYQ